MGASAGRERNWAGELGLSARWSGDGGWCGGDGDGDEGLEGAACAVDVAGDRGGRIGTRGGGGRW